jgi:hypothetical protein
LADARLKAGDGRKLEAACRAALAALSAPAPSGAPDRDLAGQARLAFGARDPQAAGLLARKLGRERAAALCREELALIGSEAFPAGHAEEARAQLLAMLGEALALAPPGAPGEEAALAEAADAFREAAGVLKGRPAGGSALAAACLVRLAGALVLLGDLEGARRAAADALDVLDALAAAAPDPTCVRPDPAEEADGPDGPDGPDGTDRTDGAFEGEGGRAPGAGLLPAAATLREEAFRLCLELPDAAPRGNGLGSLEAIWLMRHLSFLFARSGDFGEAARLAEEAAEGLAGIPGGEARSGALLEFARRWRQGRRRRPGAYTT